jgi:hypothetical protein
MKMNVLPDFRQRQDDSAAAKRTMPRKKSAMAEAAKTFNIAPARRKEITVT